MPRSIRVVKLSVNEYCMHSFYWFRLEAGWHALSMYRGFELGACIAVRGCNAFTVA
jgi:hypothetical protein